MPAQVVSFLRRARPLSRDWSQDELAEFYRVESALLQAGMRVETDRGLTDEGDPWFAFCRVDDGETFIHFARIDGRYIIAGPAYEGVAQGYDFPELVRDLISRHPLVQPQLQRRNNSNIFMHPAALLIAVVGTAFFKTADAKAAETHDDHHKERRHGGAAPATVAAPAIPTTVGASAGAPAGSIQVSLDAAQTLTLVASAMAAMTPTVSLGNTGGPFAPLAPLPEASPAPAAAEVHQTVQADHIAFQVAAPSVNLAVSEAPALAVPPPSTAEMGAWLSLAAVLQDLPKAVVSPATDALGSALALLPSDVARHAVQAIELAQAAQAQPSEAKPAPPAPAPAVLMVELSSAALPDVAAVRLVRDLESGGSHDSVLKIEQLPDLLTQLIAKGEHLETPVFAPMTSTPEAATGLTSAGPLPPATDGDAPIVLPADVVPTGSATTPAPVVELPAVAPHTNPMIDGIVSYFISHTGPTEIVLSGHDIVIYDSRIMTDADVLTSAESVTYTFDDGSTVSLIGSSATLHEAGALH